MFRYRVTAFYQDKETEARVAQTMVVIAEDDQTAIRSARTEAAGYALDAQVSTIKVLEKAAITPGVVHCGEPYIPFRWFGAAQLGSGGRPLPRLSP